MRPVLEIFLGETHVGSITNLASDRNVFVFDEAYLANNDRPILSLGFLDDQRQIAQVVKTPQVRLLPFFANLLPEGHLREYLATRAHVNAKRDFPLLWLLGEDLPGAVIARHADGATLVHDEAPDVIEEEIEEDPNVLKFSLAGVQLKFSAIREPKGGLTIPVHGKDGEWILKMPSATYEQVPENEYTMLSFARHVGIEVPEIGLINAAQVANMPPGIRTDLGNALYVKRFDREGGKRIHIEDFAQIFGQYPSHKYKNASYANMLEGISAIMDAEQAREFVRRLVFSIGIGNGDMHLKNWSVIYHDGRTPTLSPAYDYLSSIAYIPNDKIGLTIARTKQWEDVDNDLLKRFARHAKVASGVVLEAAREMVERMNGEWARLNDAGLLSASMVNAIDAHRRSVPLFMGRRAHPVQTNVKIAEPTESLEDEIA